MHRRVWLLVAAFAALSLALGTGGFSAASMDRGVNVAVVEDPADGYVGLEYHPDRVLVEYGSNDAEGNDPREKVHLLTLRNNLAGPVSFTVVVEDPTAVPPKVKRSNGGRTTYDLGTLDPDDSVTLQVPVVCAANGPTETWTLHVTADGEGVLGELTREVTVDCERRQTATPTAEDGAPGGTSDG